MRRTGQRGVVVGVAAVALLAGCVGTESGQPGHTFEVIDEDGVPTAVNSAVPKYDGELFTYEKILEIRPDPGNESSFLYQPAAFTMDDDGYYVADTRNHRIAVFDPSGGYVRDIGRQGEGPGDLNLPGSGVSPSFFLRDGLLSVFVGPRGVTARFRTDGSLVEEIPTAELSRRGIAMGRSPDGGLVIWELVNELDEQYMLTTARLRVFDGDGSVVAEIGSPAVRTAALVAVPWSARPARVVLNYATWPEAHYVPDGTILVSPGIEPVLHWYDLGGAPLRRVRLELPSRVTDEDRRQVEALLDGRIAEAADDQELQSLRSQRDLLRFAERKIPWSSTAVDGSGHVWLFKAFAWATAAYDPEHSYAARIVSPAGEYLGDTALPAGVRVGLGTRVVGRHLLAIVEDAGSGEMVPTVYRITPAFPGLVYP